MLPVSGQPDCFFRDMAMDKALGMGVVDAVCQLGYQIDERYRLERWLAHGEHAIEAVAVDCFRDDIEPIVDRAGLKDLEDVGMHQRLGIIGCVDQRRARDWDRAAAVRLRT